MSTSIDECQAYRCEACGETAVHPFTDICTECGHDAIEDVRDNDDKSS
jgi:ribosomal protein L37E